jgi:hypothetical protein
MQLRNHPLMSFEGKPNWPPPWFGSADSTKTLSGESGILKHVVKDVTVEKRCFLMIEHGGEGYVGALKFDDPAFCTHISTLFEQYIGRSIREIGDMDLSYTL